jgi:micrococcal nuclease
MRERVSHLPEERMRVLWGMMLVALLASQSPELPRTGVVERVVDGDTLVLHRIGHVRLIGVDTPETKDPRKPVERYGLHASAFLKRLATGQTVTIEYDQTTRDRYGRLLAYLHLPDGRVVNEEIVRQGFGFAYVKYPFKHMDRYRALEREARVAGRGIWATAP